MDGYYVGPANNHYRCLQFYIPATRRFPFSNTWRLYPTHCQIPIALQHDLFILAAADLLTALGGTILKSATAKAKHVNAIQQLTSILTNQPAMQMDETAQRVDGPAPRVAENPPPRVATTSNNITSPTTIRQLPIIHQQQTCSNNSFQILANNNDDDDMTVVDKQPTQPTSWPTSLQPTCSPTKTPNSKPTKTPAHNPTCNSIDNPNQYA
jgi:hypothetical protein